jgi:hypothetical protein
VVYANDAQLNLDGVLFHKPCAKCQDCGCQLSLSNYTSSCLPKGGHANGGDGDGGGGEAGSDSSSGGSSASSSGGSMLLVCKTHYFERFHRDGEYAGGENFKKKKIVSVAD